jgi:hypothetical protein
MPPRSSFKNGGSKITSFISAMDMGMSWIAEWDAGVEFYEDTGQFAGGKIHYGLLWSVTKA